MNKYKLIINIFACATIDKYKKEILKINETWGKRCEEKGVKLLFFLGEEKTELIDNNKYIYLENVKNDYLSATFKQNLGLKYIYENYQTEYIHICGTDTYINIDKLLIYLYQFDSNEKLYIGGDGMYRYIGNENLYFHNGGSGFIISYSILYELYPYLFNLFDYYQKLCIQSNTQYLIPACDVLLAYYIQKIDNIKIIKSNSFKGCNHKGYANTLKCCDSNIKDIIACHYMDLDDFDEYKELLENNNFYI